MCPQNDKLDSDPILENLLANAKKVNQKKVNDTHFPRNLFKILEREKNAINWSIQPRNIQKKPSEALTKDKKQSQKEESQLQNMR